LSTYTLCEIDLQVLVDMTEPTRPTLLLNMSTTAGLTRFSLLITSNKHQRGSIGDMASTLPPLCQ
jgi:hypothetical protein